MKKGISAKLTGSGFSTVITGGKHTLQSDETEEFGGKDSGLNPYDLLAAALGSCTAMTIRWYADKKKLDIKEINVQVSHNKIYAEDCMNCETSLNKKIDKFFRTIQIEGLLTSEQKEKIFKIAQKCPVYKTLVHASVIETEML